MTGIPLKYGMNPTQEGAELRLPPEAPEALRVRNGTPGAINILDALFSWQLVREMDRISGLPSAASFKHVSPAGAAVAGPLSDDLAKALRAEDTRVDGEYGYGSPLARAYLRARGADRMASYGDFVALSRPCDAATARVIRREVSDGIVAPGYSEEALRYLRKKRRGRYLILEIDPDYAPDPARIEQRDIFGFRLDQRPDPTVIDAGLLNERPSRAQALPDEAATDLLLGMAVLRYTPSNSVCYVTDGQAIGIGAGQQSRIHCTRLAGDKADLWHLRRLPQVTGLPFKDGLSRSEKDTVTDLYLSANPEEVLGDEVWPQYFTRCPDPFDASLRRRTLEQLDKVAFVSDGFFPFGDNVERAARSGVRYIAEPGGSIRDDHVIAAADRHGMTLCFTGRRFFHH